MTPDKEKEKALCQKREAAELRVKILKDSLEEAEDDLKVATVGLVMFDVEKELKLPKSQRADVIVSAWSIGDVSWADHKRILCHELRRSSQDEFCKTNVWATCDGVRLVLQRSHKRVRHRSKSRCDMEGHITKEKP